MQQAVKTFTISTDKSQLDATMIYTFLKQSYWARNLSFSMLIKAIQNSFCVGIYDGNKQVGFLRVITDYATFAYFSDVFVLEAYRGRGLATQMIQFCLNHPELQNLRQWLLLTKDAHRLYQKFGFERVKNTERFMSRRTE
jgi:GNAT superfamily N-acetyltransferase